MTTMPTIRTTSDVRPIREAEDLDRLDHVHVEEADLGGPDVAEQGPEQEGEPDRHQEELEEAGTRARIGPHITFSKNTPSSAVVVIAKKMPSTSGIPQVTFTT